MVRFSSLSGGGQAGPTQKLGLDGVVFFTFADISCWNSLRSFSEVLIDTYECSYNTSITRSLQDTLGCSHPLAKIRRTRSDSPSDSR